MIHCMLLLAEGDMPPWVAFLIIGVVGVIMIGLGVRAIQTGQASLSRKHQAVLKLFGIEELSPKAARRIGYGQCVAGGIALFCATTGPFWAGFLAPKPNQNPPDVAQRPQPNPNANQGSRNPGFGSSDNSNFVRPFEPADHAPPPANNAPSADLASGNPNPQPPSRNEQARNDRVDPQPEAPQPIRLPPLGDPLQPLPRIEYSADQIKSTMLQGPAELRSESDRAPPGGVLVGFRGVEGDKFGEAVQALQPIYQVEDRYVPGQWHGDTVGDEVQELAPPGYAVGGIETTQGPLLTGLRLIYFRVGDDGRFDTRDRRLSSWMGTDEGRPLPLGAGGNQVVGVDLGTRDCIVSWALIHLRTELPRPKVSLPAISYSLRAAKPSEYLGGKAGTEFVDQAPEGCLLVGAFVYQGQDWGGAVNGMQPIYQLQDKYVRGHLYGKDSGTETLVLAEPGHAVAGIKVRAGLVMNAVQFAFAPLDGSRLDPQGGYFSNWIGSEGGSDYEFYAEGRACCGIFGRYGENFHGMGLGVIPRMTVSQTAESAGQRTWTSADGQFTIEATLVNTEGDKVVLQKSDGSTITVPLADLSTADQQYVNGR